MTGRLALNSKMGKDEISSISFVRRQVELTRRVDIPRLGLKPVLTGQGAWARALDQNLSLTQRREDFSVEQLVASK